MQDYAWVMCLCVIRLFVRERKNNEPFMNSIREKTTFPLSLSSDFTKGVI